MNKEQLIEKMSQAVQMKMTRILKENCVEENITLDELYATCAEIAIAHYDNRWVRAEESWPDKIDYHKWSRYVLILSANRVHKARYSYEHHEWDLEDGGWINGVTHWMPLPTPPSDLPNDERREY